MDCIEQTRYELPTLLQVLSIAICVPEGTNISSSSQQHLFTLSSPGLIPRLPKEEGGVGMRLTRSSAYCESLSGNFLFSFILSWSCLSMSNSEQSGAVWCLARVMRSVLATTCNVFTEWREPEPEGQSLYLLHLPLHSSDIL